MGAHQAALVTDIASDRTHDLLMVLLGRHIGAAVVFRWAGIDARRTGAGDQERGEAHGGTGAPRILSVGRLIVILIVVILPHFLAGRDRGRRQRHPSTRWLQH